MGSKVIRGINDLASTNPALAAEWDFERNAPLIPENVSGGLNQKAFWICSKGHSYESSINSRNIQKTGCPYCAGQKILAGYNDLATTHPEIAMQWDYETNSPISPTEISKGTKKKFHWLCSKGHSYEASVGNRVAGRGCSICSGKKVIAGVNDLVTNHPEIAIEWDYSKNAPLTPQEISQGSNKTAFWLCSQNHSYEATVGNRIGGKACPFCSGKKVLAGFNDLATTHPEIAADWDHEKNQTLTPKQVSKGTYLQAGKIVKIWWICPLGHSYEKSIGHRVAGQDCPICSGRQVSTGFNDLATTHPEIAKEWDFERNAPLTPRDVSAGSGSKVFWLCQAGHSYRSVIGARTNGGTGCPKCAKYGFDSSQEGMFYIIKNEALAAKKIGITNPQKAYDRLAAYGSDWKVLYTYSNSDGLVIRELETSILRWIRKELGLPQYLLKEDMGKSGGQSETFSDEGVSDEQVVQKVESILSAISKV